MSFAINFATIGLVPYRFN